MARQASLSASKCAGINHADFSLDGRYLIMTCEYAGRLVPGRFSLGHTGNMR